METLSFAANISASYQALLAERDTVQKEIDAIETSMVQVTNGIEVIRESYLSIARVVSHVTESMTVNDLEDMFHVLETQNCARVEHYKKHLEEIDEKLCVLRKTLVLGAKAMIPNGESSDILCTICFKTPVDSVSVPCGHMCCETCQDPFPSTCRICRTSCSYIKVHFSV